MYDVDMHDFFHTMCNTLTSYAIIPMETTKRNPEGLVREKPIALRLMPQELLDAERIASEMNLTKSCLARKAYLAGLPFVSSSAAPSPAGVADFSGGGGIPSTAGLSSAQA